jgi:hypothetical protein
LGLLFLRLLRFSPVRKFTVISNLYFIQLPSTEYNFGNRQQCYVDVKCFSISFPLCLCLSVSLSLGFLNLRTLLNSSKQVKFVFISVLYGRNNPGNVRYCACILTEGTNCRNFKRHVTQCADNSFIHSKPYIQSLQCITLIFTMR